MCRQSYGNFTVLEMIRLQIRTFRKDEDGAVTLDFTVLVATICLLGLAVVGTFDDEVLDVSNDIASNIATIEVTP